MGTPGAGGGHRAEINVTPMIDVLLVLIIIFLVIAPVASRGLPALVPQPPPAAPPERAAPRHDIVVSVHEDGSLFLNREAMDLPALDQRLKTLFRNAPPDVVFVRGDRQLRFRRVAEVLDVIRGAGVRSIGLMTN